MAEDIVFRVYAGTGSVFLAWWHPGKISGCLGYAVNRRVDGGAPAPLEAYVGFSTGQGVQPNADGQPSTVWPFQRFTWTDFNPPASGEVEYQVVALTGSMTSLTGGSATSAWTKPTTPTFGAFTPFFNFGIVGSRWFATEAHDYPQAFRALRAALGSGADPTAADSAQANAALQAVLKLPMVKGGPAAPTIGDELGGPLSKRIKTLLADALADASVELYLALFELSDNDLIDDLAKLGPRCHLNLANGTHEKGVDENVAAANALAGKVDLSRRMLAPSGVYAHNKFVVVVRDQKPQSVFMGSTNWSPHGLYTQVNNGLLIADADIAQAYLDEWKRLKAAEDQTPPPPLAPAQEQYHFTREGTSASLFFSPHRVPKAQGAESPDLKYAAALIRGARRGVLTLMLNPGWQGSLLQVVRETATADPSLYVRGVVNSDPTIYARAGDATAIGFLHGPEAVPSNYDIVVPRAQHQPGQPIEDYIGRIGIVVVHSKVIVIDALGDHPVVMTGSHNDGVKAATINDDNLIIIEDDRNLAVAYAINIISTFNHFWWRHNMAPASVRRKAKAAIAPIAGPGRLTSPAEWKGLNAMDAWQDKFYVPGVDASEARFWGVQT